MRRLMTIAIAVAAASVPLALAACGGGGDDGATTAAVGATVAGATASEAGFDQAFIDAMVAHHEEAIEMAQGAKEAGLAEPDLVEISDDVIATQQAEIDQMLEWRTSWFGSDQIDPDAGDALGLSMEDMGMAGDAGMFATSDDVDALFATLMMDHHNGAIQMAEMALDRAEHQELMDLAERIIEAQQAEVETMMPHASGMGMDHS